MTLLLPDLLPTCDAALAALRGLQAAARASVADLAAGQPDAAQPAVHGYAWLATHVEALARLLDWARRLEAAGTLGEREGLMLQAAFGEYIARIHGGIPMAPGEFTRPADWGLDAATCHRHHSDATVVLRREGNTAPVRRRIAELLGKDGAALSPRAAGRLAWNAVEAVLLGQLAPVAAGMAGLLAAGSDAAAAEAQAQAVADALLAGG